MTLRSLLAAVLAAALAGCAFIGPYSPRAVPPGASRADIERLMQRPPTAVYTMPDGHVRLEYNHLPAGLHTFMIDLDASGRMAHWESVLDEHHFDAISPGLTMAEVRARIGPPHFTGQYLRPTPGITWFYRFETIQRCTVFELAFDKATGRVLDGSYPPDPECADEHL